MRVVVVPFHPIRYYFSDCDKNISKKSSMDVQRVRNGFRAGLDYAAESKMEKKYDPINLYQLKDSMTVDLLDRFYDNVTYTYDTPSRPMPKTKGGKLKMMGANKKKKANRVPEEECYSNLEAEDPEYMKASFTNQAFFDEFKTVYPADFYVTINQFEVKTDYDKCIDRELGRYRRRIKVHFNVFNAEGKQVWGDVVTAKYDSVSDDINEIIRDNCPFLAEYITNVIPKH